MSRYERNFYGKLKQASVVSWCAFKDNFVSLGIPARSVGRTLAKLECGEKSKSGRKVVKLPVSARRRLLRQSCDRVGGACEEAGIKVQNDQEFASTGWGPSLTKYMEKTKTYSCQTLNSLRNSYIYVHSRDGAPAYECSGFCMPFRGTSTSERVGHTFGSMRAWQPKCECSETDLLLAETFI